MNMDANLRMVTKPGFLATPKRQRIQATKVIDVIELSDDSDADIDAPEGRHQRKPLDGSRQANTVLNSELASASPSKSGFRGQGAALVPEVFPSPSPRKSVTARTRTQKRLNLPANVDVEIIDISSDEEEPAVNPMSPIRRRHLDIQSSEDNGKGLPLVSAINWGGRKPLGFQELDFKMALDNTLVQENADAKGKGKERTSADDDIQDLADTVAEAQSGSKPTAIPSVADAVIPQIQRPQVFASGPIASGSNSRHHNAVTAKLPLPNEGCPGDQTRMQPGVNYEDTNREVPSDVYRQLSVHYLRATFPFLPKNVIAAALYQHDDLYAPTYLYLHAAEQRYTATPQRDERPYQCNATKYSAAAGRRSLAHVWDEPFGREWAWVEKKMGRGVAADACACMRESHSAAATCSDSGSTAKGVPVEIQMRSKKRASEDDLLESVPGSDKRKGKQRAVDADADVQDMQVDGDIAPVQDNTGEEGLEGDIECGCCFGEYSFDEMVQCPDGHLFCNHCILQYAATQLGAHNPSLVCMDSSDCKLAFPESELRRVLTPKLMDLYSRLISQRMVAAAGLDGLEECPFCDWKCVMEVPVETDTLFRCGNGEGGCGVVSCRQCKKKDHLPKTCQEMERDHILDGQHSIEEAMTRALMRNCPNPRCNKAFIKEAGCNKMTCPFCSTYSCYVCRKIITGYGHFGRRGCKLHEDVETRHANEVLAAAKQAAEELRRLNPEIDHEAIKVDLPKSPAARAAQQYQQEQRRQQQQQLLLQRRQDQFRDFFRRQETLRQEDLRRRREGAEALQEENWVREELVQQQKIAVQARRVALGTHVASRRPDGEDPVDGPGPSSQQSDPYARAYAHAFNMLHGKTPVLAPNAQ